MIMLDLVAKAQGLNKPAEVISKRKINSNIPLHIYRGNHYSLRELSDISGLSWFTLRKRIKAGWTVEDAMTKPLK